MARRYKREVSDNLEKCQCATLAAVEVYNKPGKRFRTAHYLVMLIIGWTALFHAIFYKDKIKPWYKKNGKYLQVGGDIKHWDLKMCLKQYYGSSNPAVRKNLEFLIGLRNKIEHRYLPQFDASLYGECQAALINLEELLVEKFGDQFALQENLAVSLQFSTLIPSEKKQAARALANNSSKSVTSYIERFRGRLPSATLNSMKYSFNVYLVPRVVNRKRAADTAVEFIHVDEASDEELRRLERLHVLIKEKKIPIHNLDLYKPSQVVARVNESCAYRMTLNSHTETWKRFNVRPPTASDKPERCNSKYCVYDEPHKDYLYTEAWVDKCIESFNDAEIIIEITGREPVDNPDG